jgi:ZIP family zinc transporter
LSFAETVLLGALAGFTIFLGLPGGRLKLLSTRARVALAMFSVGILTFLLVDVLAHGFEISEDAVSAFHDGRGSFARAAALALLLVGGFAAGSAGLGILERRLRPTAPLHPPIAGGATDVIGAEDERRLRAQAATARAGALQTGLIIAAAIGLHNFAEGVAIGVSARAGEIGLATVLIVGFALHNSTEGFGIIGPLGDVKPSWRWLALAGLIGGARRFWARSWATTSPRTRSSWSSTPSPAARSST